MVRDHRRGARGARSEGRSVTARVTPEDARAIMVRRGYAQMRRLHAELGISRADEDSMGTPSVAFGHLSVVMDEAADSMRGEQRADARAIAEALAGLAILANGMTWTDVR